jgi:hypothetical protein
MSKNTSLMLGVGFAFLGLLGALTFQVPGADKDTLLGLFSNSPAQTVLYLVTGLGLVWCYKWGKKCWPLALKITAVVFGLLTLVSVVEKGSVLGIYSVNMFDMLLYFVVAVMATTHLLADDKDK